MVSVMRLIICDRAPSHDLFMLVRPKLRSQRTSNVSTAPLSRRRPDMGEIFLDRVPGQGWPKATAKRPAKPVLDAAHDRETLKSRVGGEP